MYGGSDSIKLMFFHVISSSLYGYNEVWIFTQFIQVYRTCDTTSSGENVVESASGIPSLRCT
jgi:hypothetical protein